jgi:hypothetical protein
VVEHVPSRPSGQPPSHRELGGFVGGEVDDTPVVAEPPPAEGDDRGDSGEQGGRDAPPVGAIARCGAIVDGFDGCDVEHMRIVARAIGDVRAHATVLPMATTSAASTRYEFRYDRWCGWMLGLLGMGRRVSRVEVAPDDVVVVMGWAFRVTIPRSSVVDVERSDGFVAGWGVHGWRGRWLVNGSSRGLVRMRIDPPAPSRVVGFPGRLRELRVSVVEPDALVAHLRR